ncbi:MAG: glutamate 5-kinase [Ignavibacteriae bacterium]|nr:MAG: glutamate 5-kinase [Ignavibacteriota bacterium]
MHRFKSILRSQNKIVVKIGTNLLADKVKGINLDRINEIARSVARFTAQGNQVAIVSSGAIGAGVAALGLKERPKTIPEKQATAAIGQPLLMEAYEHAFRKQGCTIAQILLTKDDFVNRARYLNAKNTFPVLFEQGVVPIINENDTVAVEEIKLGDNDNLSAMVANLIGADLLVILSDIDGLFSDDPAKNHEAELIPVVERLTPQIERLAKSSKSELSTGGMITKIQAAKRCVSAGIAMIIANGKNQNALDDIFSGTFNGTLFLPSDNKLNMRKKWIGFVSSAKGYVRVDDGAKNALLKRNKSLLPSGIVEVHGEFKVNETISILDLDSNVIAKGVTGYSSTDLGRIKGKKTGEIEVILNRKSHDEVIHRNNLVLIGEPTC